MSALDNRSVTTEPLAVSRTRSSGSNRLEPIPLGPLPERPLVSILMANYNYAAYLGAAIESALHQTYEHFELIMVDDGSTDDSCAVMERYAQQDARIRLLPSSGNRGQADAFSRAFAASKGDIICLLDSDDTMTPDKLERVVEHFQAHPTIGAVNHRIMMVDAGGRGVLELPYVMGFEHGWIAERVILRGGRWLSMPGCAIAFRRDVGEVIFPLPEAETIRAGDHVLIPIVPLLTEVSGIDAVLYHYRVHGQNDTGGLALTPERLEKFLVNVERSVGCVNRHLVRLGMPERQIDYRRDLGYRQNLLELRLLRGDPRLILMRDYARVASMLVRDDLYGRLVGLGRAGVYGVAVLLPRRWRARWLNAIFGYHAVKQVLRAILRHLRFVLFRARRRSVEML